MSRAPEQFETRLLDAHDCSPPHRLTHPEKLEELMAAFTASGWDEMKPNLFGYPWMGRIQLVSGSHRWLAAYLTDTKIPTDVYSFDYIYSIWGTDKWVELVQKYSG